jgi:16S rRNA (cytosine967-C5)-methyltransferase
MSAAGGRARAAAAKVVDQVLTGGRTLDRALSDFEDDSGSAQETSRVKALAFGSLRWHHRNRLIIGELLERPLRKKDLVLEALLSVGLFEMTDPHQPEYAVVSEAVEASRKLGRPHASRLINATLRRYQRESEELLGKALENDEARYAHPRWLIDQLRKDWPDDWQSVLNAAQEHPPMWLRVNRMVTSREDYALRLRDETGIQSRGLSGFGDALRLDRPLAVGVLPGFEQGMVSVQDAASQLAADLLAPAPGMRILDACAAPGGKSGHLLERSGGQIRLYTVEQNIERNRLIEENLTRLGLSATVMTGDAREPEAWAGGDGSGGDGFDRILVDAPCSSTGVIRRHPDIKFLRRSSDIDGFVERQKEMLEVLWPLVKPGGRLLYATCSVIRRENSGVVSAFLERHPDARELRPLPPEVVELMVKNDEPGYQLLPGAADTDGFYYALMERHA